MTPEAGETASTWPCSAAGTSTSVGDGDPAVIASRTAFSQSDSTFACLSPP